MIGLQQLAKRGMDAACAAALSPHLGAPQRMPYMLAVGPPRSLTTPENSGSAAMRRISASTDSRLRFWMIFP